MSTSTKKLKVAVVGATGFTGSELLRLLVHHPNVEVAMITSESRKGERFSDVHPFFEGIVDDTLQSAEALDDIDVDVVFLALPHGVSMDYIKRFNGRDFRIVDLSGDFRLSGPKVYEHWYKKDHVFPEGFKSSAYGIPELYGEDLPHAKIVANPGCFPTGAILGLAPLLKEKLIDPAFVIVDSKTGVTGAGIKSKPVNLYSNVNENFKAYGLKTHRHSVEIQENAERLSGTACNIQFTPHLLPVDRGILSTIYVRPAAKGITEQDVAAAFKKHYGERPFIRILRQSPEIKHVRGTNYCDVYATYDERTGNIMIVTAIDNLVRGAAGQAVQNMNLMFGLDERLGLHQLPIVP